MINSCHIFVVYNNVGQITKMLLELNNLITLGGKGLANYENNYEFSLIVINQVIKELLQTVVYEMRKNGA